MSGYRTEAAVYDAAMDIERLRVGGLVVVIVAPALFLLAGTPRWAALPMGGVMVAALLVVLWCQMVQDNTSR